MPPPLTDPLLDRPEVKQGIKDAWHDSGADRDTLAANHLEHLYGVYRTPGDTILVQQIPTRLETPCGVDFDSIPKRLDDAVLVATIHPHPMLKNQTLPANCGTKMAGLKYTQGIAGRVSDADWDTSKGSAGVPGFIIDYDGIYWYDGPNAVIDKTFGFTIVKNIGQGVYKHWDRFDTQKLCSRP